MLYYYFNYVYKIPQYCTCYEISIFEVMQQDIVWTKIVDRIQFLDSTYSGSICKYVSFTVAVGHTDVISNHSGA